MYKDTVTNSYSPKIAAIKAVFAILLIFYYNAFEFRSVVQQTPKHFSTCYALAFPLANFIVCCRDINHAFDCTKGSHYTGGMQQFPSQVHTHI